VWEIWRDGQKKQWPERATNHGFNTIARSIREFLMGFLPDQGQKMASYFFRQRRKMIPHNPPRTATEGSGTEDTSGVSSAALSAQVVAVRATIA
jgi:hypothetical protein